MKLSKRLLAILLILVATISLSLSSFAAAPKTATPHRTAAPTKITAKVATKGRVTAAALNVRSGPGKTYKKIGTLKRGASVSIVSTKGAWKKVHYKNITGYVSGKYIR